MSVTRRRRLLVDWKLQGGLLLNNTLYWFYCLLSVALVASCWIVFARRPSSSAELVRLLGMNFGPALLGSVLLLPLVLMDSLRFSNRFAGAMLRLQREMKKLADGQVPDPVHIRRQDFWADFAEDFNRVAAWARAARQSPGPPWDETPQDPRVTPAAAPAGDPAPGEARGSLPQISI